MCCRNSVSTSFRRVRSHYFVARFDHFSLFICFFYLKQERLIVLVALETADGREAADELLLVASSLAGAVRLKARLRQEQRVVLVLICMAARLYERGDGPGVVQPLASEEELQVVVYRHVLRLLYLHNRHVDLREALSSTFTAKLCELRKPVQPARAGSIVLATVSAVTGHASLFTFQRHHATFAHPGIEQVLEA